MTRPSFSQTSLSGRHRRRSLPDLIGLGITGVSIALFASWLLGRLLGRFYFFELFTHFDVQYRWLAYGLLIVLGLYRLVNPKLNRSGVALIPFILLASVICFNQDTWTPGDFDKYLPQPPGDVRVFHANVLYTREEYETTLALIRQQKPNLYVLQEMTPQSIRLVTSRLHSEFPYWFACWSKGPCWTLVGSRTPIRVDRALARKWRIIALKTQVRGQDMSLITVHPRTPLLPSWFRERNAQLAYAAKATRQSPGPTVLIGDFNISVFSPIYEDLFGPSESAYPAFPTSRTDYLRAARHRLTQPTWPRFFTPLMIPIDHAFANSGFPHLFLQTLAHPGSDHRAIVVDLRFVR